MKPLICLVTGANSGIGHGLALLLAEAGHRVVLCCRTMDKARAAREEVVRKTGNEQIEVLAADMADPVSVRAAVREFLTRHERLDVLCNISGSTFWEREETERGVEKNLAVNLLGPFLLSNLLLEALRAAPQGRVVNVVGEFHRKAELDLDDLQWVRRKYSIMKSGATSMLMRVMWTRELARRLDSSSVRVYCFHPGAVRSNLMHSFPRVYRILLGWVQIFFLSARKGADTGCWLALSAEPPVPNGGYFNRRQAVEPSRESQKREKAARLWAIAEEMTAES